MFQQQCLELAVQPADCSKLEDLERRNCSRCILFLFVEPTVDQTVSTWRPESETMIDTIMKLHMNEIYEYDNIFQRLRFGEFLADNIVRFINLFTYLLTYFYTVICWVTSHICHLSQNILGHTALNLIVHRKTLSHPDLNKS